MPGSDLLVATCAAFCLRALGAEQMPESRRAAHHFARGRDLEALGHRFFSFLHGKVFELRRPRRGRPNDVPRHRQSRAESAPCAGSGGSGTPIPEAGIPHKLAVSTLAVDRRTANHSPRAVLRARRARGRRKKGMHGLKDRVIDLNHLAHNSEGLPRNPPRHELTQPRQPSWAEYRLQKPAVRTACGRSAVTQRRAALRA
jgi:hypothetical protein